MKVAIVVDSPKRDLDGALLTACQLARRGAEAFLVPMYQQGYDLPWLRPEGVIVNYARANNRELLAAYRALGMCVIVMDTEGGVLSDAGLDAPLNWARAAREDGLCSLVDHYFFWGPRLAGAFRAESGMPAEALHVTGCPRFDFCAEPWRRLLEFPARGHVLVNTNFSAINPGFTRSREAERAIFRQLGWAEDYVERLFAELGAVFPRYLDTIDELARRLPGTRFRLRPHPFEDESLYRRRFAGATNLVVDGSGSVLPAIANAACVVHLNCGTAIESLMLDVPALSLEFLNSEIMRAHAPLPSRASTPAASLDELEQLVARAEALKRDHAPRRAGLAEELLRPWFHEIDGRAAERVAEQALEAVGDRAKPRRSLRLSLFGSRGASAGRLVSGLTANLIGSERASRLAGLAMPQRRAKRLPLEVVETGIARLRSADNAMSSLCATRARHPVSRQPMASIRISAETA